MSESRDVTAEEYRQATEAAAQCLRDSGLVDSVSIDEYQDMGGLDFGLNIRSTNPDIDAVSAMGTSCELREQDFIETAYQSRAAATEWLDALYARYKPALIACVRAKGIVVPDDVDLDTLMGLEHDANPDEFETRCAATTGFEDEVNGRG